MQVNTADRVLQLGACLCVLCGCVCVVGRGGGDSLLGVGNISLLSYIVILRAHDNRIVVVLKLSSYRVHIISGVVFAEIRHAVAK